MTNERSNHRGVRAPFRHIIASRRQELKLTQAQVAKSLGITSPEYIGLLEKELRTLDFNKVPRLADALSLPRTELTKIAFFEQFPLAYAALYGENSPKEVKPLNAGEYSADAAFIKKLNMLDRTTRNSIVQLVESSAARQIVMEGPSGL